MPASVSNTRGAGLPSMGSRDRPFHHQPAERVQVHQLFEFHPVAEGSRMPPAPGCAALRRTDRSRATARDRRSFRQRLAQHAPGRRGRLGDPHGPRQRRRHVHRFHRRVEDALRGTAARRKTAARARRNCRASRRKCRGQPRNPPRTPAGSSASRRRNVWRESCSGNVSATRRFPNSRRPAV